LQARVRDRDETDGVAEILTFTEVIEGGDGAATIGANLDG
jgi:hypothetical protein